MRLDLGFRGAHHALTEWCERHRKGSSPKAHQPEGEVRTGRYAVARYRNDATQPDQGRHGPATGREEPGAGGVAPEGGRRASSRLGGPEAPVRPRSGGQLGATVRFPACSGRFGVFWPPRPPRRARPHRSPFVHKSREVTAGRSPGAICAQEVTLAGVTPTAYMPGEGGGGQGPGRVAADMARGARRGSGDHGRRVRRGLAQRADRTA
jgi:hypothetical protein